MYPAKAPRPPRKETGITKRRTIGPWERTRRLVQLVVLAAFVALTVALPLWEHPLLPENLFSRLDPLVGLTASIASRTLVAYAAFAILTTIATLVLGRAWCGWVCPVGTLLDLMPARGRHASRGSGRWRMGKYALLAGVIGAAVFGTLWPMIIDPITMAIRPLQELVLPAVGSDAIGRSAGVYISRDELTALAFTSVIPLVLVLSLNALGRRTWCHAMCPLGALLGILSKVPGIRRQVDADACTSCGRCARSCPTRAIQDDNDFASAASECTVCMACVDICPESAVSFSPHLQSLPASAYRPDRREAIATLGATGASLVFVGILSDASDVERILRPPGTTDHRLAELCVRCGACFSACPTGHLRPSLAFTSVAGLWTPQLDERPVHCSLDCNLCANVCPTDALHTPTPAEAAMMGLGRVAHVDRDRCVSWARNEPCMKCRSACPISGALVESEHPPIVVPPGADVARPQVVHDLCVACDLCAAACPAWGGPAIGTFVGNYAQNTEAPPAQSLGA